MATELAVGIDLPQRVEHDVFDRGLDAGVDVEQRVEVDRLLRDAEHALARRAGGARAARLPPSASIAAPPASNWRRPKPEFVLSVISLLSPWLSASSGGDGHAHRAVRIEGRFGSNLRHTPPAGETGAGRRTPAEAIRPGFDAAPRSALGRVVAGRAAPAPCPRARSATGVFGCICPIRSMSAEITVPIMK